MAFHMRLQTKLLVVVSVLVVMVVLISSGVVTLSQKKRLTESTYRMMARDARYLSRRISHNIYNSNWRTIQITMDIALQANEGMLYYAIHDQAGRVLFSSDLNNRGTMQPYCIETSPLSGEVIPYRSQGFTVRERPLSGPAAYKADIRGTEGEEVFDTCMEVHYIGHPIGCLRIGYSKRELSAHIQKSALDVLAGGGAILLTVMLGLLVLIRISIAPLGRLNRKLLSLRQRAMTESLGEVLGNADILQISENSTTTEIRELSLSFNALSELLVESWHQLQAHQVNLEQNVARRTGALRKANRALLREIAEKKEAEEKLRVKNSLMVALHDTTLDLMRHLEFNELLELLLKRAGGLMGMESGFYFDYRESTNQLHSLVSSGPFADISALPTRVGEGLVGKVWQSDRPLYVSDYKTWEGRMKGQPGLGGLGASVAVPIRLDDNVGGVLGLAYFGDDFEVDEAAMGVLIRFGELASIALNNAMMHSKLQGELDERRRVEAEKDRLFQHLLQAQKLEAIGTLAGGVAHDINNLLMAVQGNASLIVSLAKPGDTICKRGGKIEELVASGAKLTSQLLGFARGGRYHVRPESVSTVVKSSLSLFGRTRKGIMISEHLAPDLPNVELDRTQMEQVLLNLYLNASHAMPDGGRIRIETGLTELDSELSGAFRLKPGAYVTVAVSDTGVGMDKSTQSKIFDPFFTTREMGRGTGLGLASAYGIVKNHKGAITVTSEEGRGTCFTIHLPATDKHRWKDDASTVSIRGGEGTVLVVDDELEIREVVKTMLKGLGYRCLEAENSSQCLSIFREQAETIDLVLLDVVMPDAGGDIAYQAMKKIDPDVRVILCSGYSREGRAEKMIDAGCRGFIQKPFTLEVLSTEIHRVLQG
ncbi:ATP-binding protein [Desulfoluna sp.]|uniref:ATP-binding protein n=1 Tax=Desulfoluna sp. TaxID=2045199 RepID=UPI00262572B0|nr:ATP-binding protein [Desulfoluna sp.]